MPADDMQRLMHMLNYAEKTAAIAKSSREDLETDTMPEFALLHGVQTIGEAAVNVSEATRNRFPSIPWSKLDFCHFFTTHAARQS